MPASAGLERRHLGLAMLVGVALGWGLNWPAMKIILSEVPPWQFRAVTGAGGALVLVGLARLLGQRLAVPRGQWPPLVAAALLNITSWFVLIAYGVQLMASSHAAILGFTMPVWAAILGVLAFGERLSARRLVSLGMGAAGVAVLLSRDLRAVGASPLGAALTLLGAANWAVGVLIQKRVKWGLEPLALAAWQVGIGTVPIVVIAAFAEPFVYHRASAAALFASAYLVLVALAFCYYAWFTAVKIFPAQVSAIGSLLVPVVGVVSATLMLGEPFAWREMTALILVVGAVGLVLMQPADPAADRAAPTAAAARTE